MNFRPYFGAVAAAVVTVAGFTAPALAQNGTVSVKSDSFVEKVSTDAQGNRKVSLVPPTIVVPGDTVVFTHDYVNNGTAPATGFLINNPLSKQIQFVSSPDANLVVSVDGGKTYGKLASLKVSDRAATNEDVTNLRWTFSKPIMPGERGKVSFRGILR